MFSGQDGVWGVNAEDPATMEKLFSFGNCFGDPGRFRAPYGAGEFSPDGTQIAVVARDCEAGSNSPYALWRMSLDGSETAKIGDSVPLDDMTPPDGPTWSHDGQYIAVETPYPYALRTYDVQSGAMVVIPEAHQPEFAADAPVLAYTCNKATDYRDVCVADQDGSNARTLVSGVTNGLMDIALSPDGETVVYKCGNDVCAADRTSGQTKKIASVPTGATEPSHAYYGFEFAPDGSSVAAISYDGSSHDYGLKLLDPTGGLQPLPLGGREGVARNLEWAPDSSAIAFNGIDSSGRDRIRVIAVDDGATVSGPPLPESQGWIDDGGAIHRLDWQGCSTTSCTGPAILTAPCTISGTSSDDVLVGTAGADVICGGPGRDRIVSRGGNDVIRGGTGADTLDMRAAPAGIRVDLGANVSTGWGNDQLSAIENVVGSQYADRLLGGPGRNIISGGAGADLLTGGTDDDTLLGNDGNDTLRGGAGDDDLAGGQGADRASFADSPARVRVNLANGLSGGFGTDMLVSIENVVGSGFDDFIVGTDGVNLLSGGDGIDTVQAGGGHDVVAGGDDRDYLYGEAGPDRLDGGAGRDYLNGGSGNDACMSGVVNKSC